MAKKKKTSDIVERNEKAIRREEKKAAGKEKKNSIRKIDETLPEDRTLFGADRKDFKEIISPEGLDLTSDTHLIVYDGVSEQYVVSMTVNLLPKRTRFATTFKRLFDFPGVTSSVYYQMLDEGEARTKADARVRALGAERADCTDIKTGRVKDENRYRRLSQKYADAQEWARRIESGDNALFAVQFLFTLTAGSADELKHTVDAFVIRARAAGIGLTSCFCAQDRAFLSAYPMNRVAKIGTRKTVAQTFYLDKFAMADIFNHTNSHFFHENGVFLGHYIDNHQCFLWDPFDRSHNGYGAVFCGQTGSGKSLTVKVAMKRMIDFGMRVRVVDVDSPGRFGEYSALAKAAGGVHFELKPDSGNVLNPYDITEEEVYEESTGLEYPTLMLSEKLAYLEHLIFSMIEIGKGTMEKVTENAIKSIITKVNYELYEERGIYDRKPDSLYSEQSSAIISSGRKKKLMPTLSDAYKKILLMRAHNENGYYGPALQILVDTLQFYIRELYYSDRSCVFFTKEEYDSFDTDEFGRKYTVTPAGKENVTAVIGTKPYFDGQSTMTPDYNTPFVDYDISQLPREEKAFAMIACLGYMEENDVRTNSSNPLRAQPMIILMDELHMSFPYAPARQIVTAFYRTCRKRLVAPFCATQSLSDFDAYEDTVAIFKNSDSQFMFRHSDRDRACLKKHLSLTDSQVEQILNLGMDPTNVEATAEERNARRGEVCVIDQKRVAFIKIDYLVETEAGFAETNVAKIKELTEARRREAK